MRLMIKQRVFAWTDTYDIYDEWGNKKYFVKSEVLVADRVEASRRNLHSSSLRTVLSMEDGSVMEISFRGITVSQLEAGWWQI